MLATTNWRLPMFDHHLHLINSRTDINEGLVGMASVLIVLILGVTLWGMFV